MAKQTRRLAAVRKKRRKRIYRGVVFLQLTKHNTIVTITNIRGDALCWSSSGACGFKGKRKGTGFAAKKVAETAARKSKEFAMKEAKIIVVGPGQGREGAIREIYRAGIKVSLLRDKTVIPHNGCRPPKKRRV